MSNTIKVNFGNKEERWKALDKETQLVLLNTHFFKMVRVDYEDIVSVYLDHDMVEIRKAMKAYDKWMNRKKY
jgi:hypothetical protein